MPKLPNIARATAVLELLELLRGHLHVAFEKGTPAQWLAGLLQPRVAQVLVCDPRKNDRRGSKNDRIDARESRRSRNQLKSKYPGNLSFAM